MVKEEREAAEALIRIKEALASTRVELQATRASLKQANEVMMAEGARAGVGQNTVLDSVRTLVPEEHAESEMGRALGTLLDQAATLLQRMRGDVAEEDGRVAQKAATRASQRVLRSTSAHAVRSTCCHPTMTPSRPRRRPAVVHAGGSFGGARWGQQTAARPACVGGAPKLSARDGRRARRSPRPRSYLSR